LREQLLLKRLGRGRHDDALPRLERRDQIREALAGAGTRLRDEVFAAREGALDGHGKGSLLRPRFVAGQRRGERAARAECVSHGCRSYATERMFPWDHVQ
jgi:hypothetical protein